MAARRDRQCLRRDGDQRNACRHYGAAAQTDPYAALDAARLADVPGIPDEARRLYQDLLNA